MPEGATSWWEDPTTDWTARPAHRAVQLLAIAYEDPGSARRLTDAVGLPFSDADAALPPTQRWTELLRHAAARGLVLDLVAEVLDDRASTAFHTLLGTLLGDRLGVVQARRALRHGLPAVQPDAVLESLLQAPSPAGDEPRGAPEAITAVHAGFDDPAAYVQAVLDAVHRTAMVEVGGVPRGTGFLVGADLLLTAAHVLGSRTWPPDPVPRVCAVFDYYATPGRSAAETGQRVDVQAVLDGSPATPQELDGVARDGDAPEHQLDFALLRLSHPPDPPPAGCRGAYELDQTDYAFATGRTLCVLQHPLGRFQVVSPVTSTPVVNPTGTRVRYRSNTLAGSSGSPVFDSRGRLVALHHYSSSSTNQGVPVAAIARAVLAGPCAHLLTGPAAAQPAAAAAADPFGTTSLLGRPFVNRTNLRDRLARMARDECARTLAITGESGSGVSYSYLLASHVAQRSQSSPDLRAVAPGGVVAVKVDLRDFVSFGVDERRWRIVSAVLVGLGLMAPRDVLDQDARTILTVKEWVTTSLRGSDRQWWVFVDSVDDLVTLKQTQVDEVLHALVTVADDPQVPLRIVLAGRKSEQFALEHASWVERDVAAGLVRSEVERWLRTRAGEERRLVDETRLSDALGRLFPAGGPLPEPRRLATRLPATLFEVLEPTGGP